MDIMELGAIGELVGGVAVIASLIYVGIQVRQSNEHTRQSVEMEKGQTGRDLMRFFSEQAELARDPAFMEVLQRSTMDFGGLSHVDKGRVAFWMTAFAVHTVSAFLARQTGLMDKQLADAWIGYFASYVKAPGLAEWWARAASGYHPDFVAEVSNWVRGEELRPIHIEHPWLGPEIVHAGA